MAPGRFSKHGGFGNPNNWSASSIICLMEEYLLVGTYNEIDGAEIWRYDYDLSTWSVVVSGGFGDANNKNISSLAAVGEYLYAGTENAVSGGEVWRSLMYGNAGSWEQVSLDGFGDLNNSAVTSLAGAGRYLFAGTRNPTTGAELWQVELNGPDRSFVIHSGSWTPYFAAAYNNQDQQYLAMWENENDGPYDDTLQAQRLSVTGDLIGSAFMVSSGGDPAQERTCPRLAYDSLHNRYLAAWTFAESYGYEGERARLVSATGGLVGNEILIDDRSAYSFGCTELGYSPISDRYLVVYAIGTGSFSYDIHARALMADGTSDGSDVLVETGAEDVYHSLGLAYNAARNEFLVVWSGGSQGDIYGRRLKMTGGLATQGDTFAISDTTDGILDDYPSVGAIATTDGNGEYLVGWQAAISMKSYSPRVRRVSGLGGVTGDAVTICDTNISLCGRPIVSGLANRRFQIIWRAGGDGRYGNVIFGLGVDADGNLLGPKVWLTGEKRIMPMVAMVAGPGSTALVLYPDFPPNYEYLNLHGYIVNLGTNKSYLPLLSK